MAYASHIVDGEPLQRIFYELYKDKAAFEAHETAPHTRRYLDQRGQPPVNLVTSSNCRLTFET